MNLQQFIKQTLIEIIRGTMDAQKELQSLGTEAMINPKGIQVAKDYAQRGGSRTLVEFVDFDVAVASAESTESTAGAGLFVAGFGLGAKDQSELSTNLVNRIKFRVPILLPQGK